MKRACINILMATAILFTSCLSKEEKMKKAQEQGNETVAVKAKLIEGAGDALQNEGKTAIESASKGVGELVKGLNTGVSKSLGEAPVILEESFVEYFEECRAEKVYADKEKNQEKKVSVYLIPKKDFKGKIVLRALDKDKKEIGRSSLNLTISADDAKYVDFVFDERTPLLQTEFFSIR